MSQDYWKGVLKTARESLAKLRVRRDELDAEREEVNLEIVQLEQVVTNLTPLVSEGAIERLLVCYRLPTEIKLTDACREILRRNDKHMTPIEIRSALETGGYDLTQHANPLASIHGVLKRLKESGEAEQVTHDIRGAMYRWRQGIKRGNSGDPQPAEPIPGLLVRRPKLPDETPKPAVEASLRRSIGGRRTLRDQAEGTAKPRNARELAQMHRDHAKKVTEGGDKS